MDDSKEENKNTETSLSSNNSQSVCYSFLNTSSSESYLNRKNTRLPQCSYAMLDIESPGSFSSFMANHFVYNFHTNTDIQIFDDSHFKPREHTEYFLPVNWDKNCLRIGIVVTFYNEDKIELIRTLESLYEQEIECKGLFAQNWGDAFKNIEFYYIAVMDGYYKAADSTIAFIASLYGDEYDSSFAPGDLDDKTLILSKKNEDGTLGKVNISNKKSISLSVVIKKQNRKKANSHEWFFKAFVPHMKANFAFTTDCGTLFGKRCLFYLIRYLLRHKEVSAVTGRQRVMNADMQGSKGEGLQQMWYRSAQAYDYETSISAFQGAFSMFGMLPVLPGPCALFRCSDIEGDCLGYYMDFIQNASDNNSLVTGNLLLAEDRILSFAAALKTGKYTKWVPESVFYFEAETKTESFIAQRRRWTNGTFYCYFYLLFYKPQLIFKAKGHSTTFKMVIYVQILLQWILYCVTSLSPALFVTILYYGILGSSPDDAVKWFSFAILGLYSLLYTSFCIGHYFVKYIAWLYNTVLYFNVITFFFVMIMNLASFLMVDIFAISVLCASMFFPFLLALLHDFDAFVMMIFNFIPFFFFLPTFIPWYASYSMARTWDLSWGNRPPGCKKDLNTKTKIKLQSFFMLILTMIANFGLTGTLVYFNDKKIMIYMTLGVLGFSLIQQIFSLYYFLFKTDHVMSTALTSFKKTSLKLLCVCLFLLTALSLCTSVFTSAWLTTKIPVYLPQNLTFVPVNHSYREKINQILTVKNNSNYLTINNFTLLTKTETNVTSVITLLKKNSAHVDHYFGPSAGGLFVTDYYYNETTKVSKTLNFTLKGSSNSPHFNTEYFSTVYLKVTDLSGNEQTQIFPVGDPKGFKKSNKYGKESPLVISKESIFYTANIQNLTLRGTISAQFGLLLLTIDKWDLTGKLLDHKSLFWGKSLLSSFPSRLWGVSLFCIVTGAVLVCLNLLSLLCSFASKEKGRIYSISALYSWIGLVMVSVGILVFPCSWADLVTNHLTWSNEDITIERSLCGSTAQMWKSGNCKIGWSYLLCIFSLFFAILSYSLVKFTLGSCKELPKNKMMILNNRELA